MKSCVTNTRTNNERSLLEVKLDMINPDTAVENLAYVRSPQFKNIFGDYEADFKSEIKDANYDGRVDDNGDPLLILDESLDKYYFILKDKEKFYFPSGRSGIKSVLTTNEVKELTRSLTLNILSNSRESFSINDKLLTTIQNSDLNKTTTEYLESLIQRLENKDTIESLDLAMGVEESLPFVDEWMSEIKKFLKTFNVDLREVEDEEATKEQEEDIKGETVRKASFLKSSKSNMLSNIKLLLSIVKDTKLNKFNEPTYVAFDDIYSTLNKSFSGIVAVPNEGGIMEDPYQLYLEKIIELIPVKPYLSNLYRMLQDYGKNEVFKNQFVSAFNLHKNSFLGSEYIEDNSGNIIYNVLNLSETGSRKSNILSSWHENFIKLNSDKALKKNVEELQEFIRLFNTEKNKIQSHDDLQPYIESAQKVLQDVGVITSPEGFSYFTNDRNAEPKDIDYRKSRIDNLLNRLYSNVLNKYNNEKTKESTLVVNLFKDQTILGDLAIAEAFFMKESSDSSVYTMGKTKWIYSNPSYLSLKIKTWQRDPNLLYNHYLSTPYNENSVYMEYLLGISDTGVFNENLAKERLANIELGIFNSVQEGGDSINAVDNKSIEEVDSFVDYMHKVLGKLYSGKTWHKTALAADKSTEYQINYGVDLVRTNIDYVDGKYIVNSKIKKIFYNYFMSEYSRMRKVAEDIENGEVELIPHYHLGNKNGLKSQLFPELSVDFTKSGEVIIPKALSFDLYDSNGYPLLDALTATQEAELKEYINNSAIEGMLANFNTLQDFYVVGYNTKGEFINKSIDKNLFNVYKTNGVSNKQAALNLAADMFVNSIISQVEYGKMFTGDLAFYKNMIDYRKRVPSTYTDGLYMRTSHAQREFNVSVIAGVEIDEPSLNAMKEYLPEEVWSSYAGGKVNSTDAQAWITPQRWEFIMKGVGKWTDTHQSFYKKVFTKNPKFTAEELKVAAQPLKGVYFDVKDGRPTFLKYSQAVLLPNFIAGTKLENLYKKMTSADNYNDQIHEVITRDGVKVGYHTPTLTHSENGQMLDDFELKKLKLNNANWKLQQDLPVKGIKSTDIGSQIQKNIFQGLAFNLKDDFILDGQVKTGSELIDHINEITSAMGSIQRELFKQSLGLDDDYKINKESVLYNKIITQLEKRKDTPSNVIDGLKSGLSPYAIPGAKELFQNVFSTVVNNEMVKFQTNGGGFIQMADYGLNKVEAQDKGIRFTPWFLESEDERLHAPKINKRTVTDPETGEVVEKDVLDPGGVFISGSFIAKLIPDYKDYSDAELFGTKEEDYTDGIIDRNILESIIGYRIPNQGLPSNDAFQILGILPEEKGDTIIAYAGITTKTGSDYDIDKMYLMLPSYELDTDGYLNYVLPEEDEEGNQLPLTEQSLDALRNILIQSYKSVLTNPKIASKIMKPIDVPFFEMDILNLNPVESQTNFSNFNAITDIATKVKFKSSKSGLGTAVNHTMDFVRGSMANLRLSTYLGWGKQKGGNTSFDSEYSEELTDTELNNYITDFNSRLPEGDASRVDTKEKVDKFKKKYAKIEIADSLMALTNGFVDVANNPFIVDGNWVGLTNDLGLMLIRAGTHPFKVNAFLNQPILKEYIRFQNNIESKTVKSVNNPLTAFKLKKVADRLGNTDADIININKRAVYPRSVFLAVSEELKEVKYAPNKGSTKQENRDNRKFEAAIRSFDRRLESKVAKLFGGLIADKATLEKYPQIKQLSNDIRKEFAAYFNVAQLPFSNLKLGALRSQINKGTPNESLQERVITTYKEWMEHSKLVAKNVKASRADVDGKGKNIMSLIISQNRVNDIIQSEKFIGFSESGVDSKLERNNKPTPLATAIESGLTLPAKVMRANLKYFSEMSLTNINTFNLISEYIYGNNLVNDKLGDKLTRAYNTYLLSGFKPFQLTSKERSGLLNNMPNKLRAMKAKHKDNSIIQQLTTLEGELTNANDLTSQRFFIGISNASKGVSFKEEITDAWRDLFESDPEFAEELVKYSYLVSGGNKTKSQFFEYIPYEWFNKNLFNSYLKTFNNSDRRFDFAFIDQFFRHNYKDRAIVKQRELRLTDPMDGPVRPIGYSVVNKDQTGLSILKTTMGSKSHPYMFNLVRNVENFDGSSTRIDYYYQLVDIDIKDKATFARVYPLGMKDRKGNTVSEFNVLNNKFPHHTKTMFKENRGVPYTEDKVDAFLDGMYNADKVGTSSTSASSIQTEDDNVTDRIEAETVTTHVPKPTEVKDEGQIKEFVNKPTQQSGEVDFDKLKKESKKKGVPIFDLKDWALKEPIQNGESKITHIIPNPTEGEFKILFDRSTGQWMAKFSLKDGIVKKELFKNEGTKSKPSMISSSKLSEDFMDKSISKAIPADLIASIIEDLKNVPPQVDTKLNIKDFTYTESIDKKYGIKKTLGDIAQSTTPQSTLQSSEVQYYEGDITPSEDTIFVFGSNPEGRHGAGAAKIAKNQFGAIYGQGEGLQGNAYALPTKNIRKTITPKGSINVYWGQAESETSTRILSNLAPRKFTWEGREYGSVEHAYQSNKSGSFDKITYDKYNNINGYGKKIRGKGTVAEMKAADSLSLMKKLVVESFRQNPNSEATKKLLQYENFTHNTNQLIDKAFLEGLKLAQKELTTAGAKSVSPEQITNSIKKLYETAKANPNKQFKIAYRNTTEKSLNGYTGLEMIEMFNVAGNIPSNVIFSKEWYDTGKLSTEENNKLKPGDQTTFDFPCMN